MGYVLPDPEAVQLVASEFLGALSVRQILHADLIGKTEELRPPRGRRPVPRRRLFLPRRSRDSARRSSPTATTRSTVSPPRIIPPATITITAMMQLGIDSRKQAWSMV